MEADLAFRGIDFRDYFMPGGGPSRLTLRRLGVLVRHLPSESHTATALGSHGFSTLELVVMESGLTGPVNPRHPYSQESQESQRRKLLKDRQAHFAAPTLPSA